MLNICSGPGQNEHQAATLRIFCTGLHKIIFQFEGLNFGFTIWVKMLNPKFFIAIFVFLSEKS